MRELRAEELHFVAGGLAPITDLPGMTVHPDPVRHDTLPYQPPHMNGGSHDGGGRPGGAANGGINGGGNISTQAAAGLARIQSELGVDLTAYAKMSPTLAQAIATATTTYDFHFQWGNGSSVVTADGVHGTVTIDSSGRNSMAASAQQMAHELGHVGWHVSDNVRNETAEHFINAHLEGEGHATLMNVRIEHELKAAGGIEISIAAAAANRPVYEAEYQRFAHGQETMQQAAQNIGAHYSQHESSHGMSYHDYYQSEYRRLGGK